MDSCSTESNDGHDNQYNYMKTALEGYLKTYLEGIQGDDHSYEDFNHATIACKLLEPDAKEIQDEAHIFSLHEALKRMGTGFDAVMITEKAGYNPWPYYYEDEPDEIISQCTFDSIDTESYEMAGMDVLDDIHKWMSTQIALIHHWPDSMMELEALTLTRHGITMQFKRISL